MECNSKKKCWVLHSLILKLVTLQGIPYSQMIHLVILTTVVTKSVGQFDNLWLTYTKDLTRPLGKNHTTQESRDTKTIQIKNKKNDTDLIKIEIIYLN